MSRAQVAPMNGHAVECISHDRHEVHEVWESAVKLSTIWRVICSTNGNECLITQGPQSGLYRYQVTKIKKICIAFPGSKEPQPSGTLFLVLTEISNCLLVSVVVFSFLQIYPIFKFHGIAFLSAFVSVFCCGLLGFHGIA